MWFPLFPEQASTMAGEVDRLFFALLAVAAFFSLLIAGFIVYFAIKYRPDSRADRSGARDEHLPLEMLWTGVPVLIVLAAFARGADVYYRLKNPPKDAVEIYVTGKQWMWKVQHPDGQREINTLHVPAGVPILLTMTSEDVIHDFSVPDFRMKHDVLPGRRTQQWFQALAPGEHRIFCDQYCGTLHSAMTGKVIVQSRADYARWLARWKQAPGAAVQTGEELFRSLGCVSCHPSRAPSLEGVYGSRVRLEDGRTVEADDEYIRESILTPRAKLVKGFGPIMPSFAGQLDERGLEAVIEYVKSLKAGARSR